VAMEVKNNGKEPSNACIHCANHFTVPAKGRKWTLDSNLALDLNVYEGLNAFYTHYKGEYPLAKLEPIGVEGVEKRQVCAPCGKVLQKFIEYLHKFTLLANKDSVCAKVAGDLEEEKADWQDLMMDEEEISKRGNGNGQGDAEKGPKAEKEKHSDSEEDDGSGN